MSDLVALPREAVEALFRVYDAWWNRIAVLDPDDPKLRKYGLVEWDDCTLMEEACTAVEEHEAEIKAALGEEAQ